MSNDYDVSAIIYDPVLFLALKPVRIAVMHELSDYKNKSIIDLCGGTGNQLKLLSKNNFTDLSCLDLSKSMLKIAAKHNKNIKIYNQDATKTNFENQCFNIVIISFAIHEKDRDTQKNLIKEAHRLLKHNGLLLIVDYIFDKKSNFFAKKTISLIERIAGKEHYNNFKNYIKNNGLSSLIKQDKFKLSKSKRKLMNSVTISIYTKQ